MTVFVDLVGLFRRAGLAADAVTDDLGVFRRTLCDDGFDQLAHRRGGLLGNDLPHDRAFVLFHHIAILVKHLGDDMRFQQITSVDHRADGADDLDRRRLHGLTEGSRDQIARAVSGEVAQARLAVENTARLTRQVDAGRLHQSEGAAIIIHRFAADHQSHMSEGDVAGILQRLRGRLRAVSVMLPAVQRLRTTFEGLDAAAVEAVVQRDRAGVQARCQRDDLKGRARLVAVADAAVSPLLQTRGCHCVVVRGDRLLAFLAALRVFQRTRVHFLKRFVLSGVKDFQIVVRIVAAEGRHCDDIAGLCVIDDPKRAVEHVIAVDSVEHLLFQRPLHGQVDRQHQAVAVARLIILLIGIEHFCLIIALGRDHGAGSALQRAVIIRLQPLRALVLRVGEAEDL